MSVDNFIVTMLAIFGTYAMFYGVLFFYWSIFKSPTGSKLLVFLHLIFVVYAVLAFILCFVLPILDYIF